ncbi:FUSC family membrane protein [Zoogloea sp. LCSB751]|uniref:FUSC family protein n=1 Tax=Zoogloea sp. LCSB751 TaxID=1965277 RepID=UPI0009A52BB7|nr:FUSC family membrane protein [Zoogloea sp. LCSB751]
MQTLSRIDRSLRAARRVALSHYVASGLVAALGMLLISGGMHFYFGAFAAAAASVGVAIVIPPDQPAPQRGKFWQLLPAALIGLPLFLAVQALHNSPVLLGLLLVPASFIAFLAGAWGKRGLPISISIMFALVLSMAVPVQQGPGSIATTGLYFAIGSAGYLVFASLANSALNARYRVQMLADVLFALAGLMRCQARQFGALSLPSDATPLIGELLRRQAALADQLQAARNILLESPRTPRRQRLAGMLLQVLEIRDHLLASELDVDALRAHPGHPPLLNALGEILGALADELDGLADALLTGRQPEPFASHRPQLARLELPAEENRDTDGGTPSTAMLARGLANRLGHINDETLRLIALARGEAQPDLSLVRTAWQAFVSPTAWSWQPLAELWHWNAPPLRHAIRAALAIGSAYALSLAVPWGTHDYWILLTIVVVLRGSLAQTVERRNHRVLGTLLGCVLTGALLAPHPPAVFLLLVVMLAQGVAHAFAVRSYIVAAVAATVMGLVQSHMLNAGSATFEVIERLADTLAGVAIAWAFAYVLPSWERGRIPALVARSLAAQAHHARIALGLGQLQAVDNEPELAWRLARREAYDSLSALVQATQQSLAEPRAVRPPLAALGRLLTHNYQLLAQLTAVKTMLMQRRGRLDAARIQLPLQHATEAIDQALTAPGVQPTAPTQATDSAALPNPFEQDLSPWLLRRLGLASELAAQVREDAEQVLRPTPAVPGSEIQEGSGPAAVGE